MRLLKIADSEYINADQITAVKIEDSRLWITVSDGSTYTWKFNNGCAEKHNKSVMEVLGNIEAYGHIIDFERIIRHEGGVQC